MVPVAARKTLHRLELMRRREMAVRVSVIQ
jgi:hypothetical protein